MIVERWTFNIKIGKDNKVRDLLKAERERTGETYRIYECSIGTRPRMAIEFEFENLAEVGRYWSEVFASPEYAAFHEEFPSLHEGGTVREIWTVIE